MTVPIIENWTRVSGVVERSGPCDVAGHIQIDLRLTRVEPVNGFPNLLHATAGDVINVLIRTQRERVYQWLPGTALQGRVRRAGIGRVFAHPDDFGPEDRPAV